MRLRRLPLSFADKLRQARVALRGEARAVPARNPRGRPNPEELVVRPDDFASNSYTLLDREGRIVGSITDRQVATPKRFRLILAKPSHGWGQKEVRIYAPTLAQAIALAQARVGEVVPPATRRSDDRHWGCSVPYPGRIEFDYVGGQHRVFSPSGELWGWLYLALTPTPSGRSFLLVSARSALTGEVKPGFRGWELAAQWLAGEEDQGKENPREPWVTLKRVSAGQYAVLLDGQAAGTLAREPGGWVARLPVLTDLEAGEVMGRTLGQAKQGLARHFVHFFDQGEGSEV